MADIETSVTEFWNSAWAKDNYIQPYAIDGDSPFRWFVDVWLGQPTLYVLIVDTNTEYVDALISIGLLHRTKSARCSCTELGRAVLKDIRLWYSV